MERIKNILNILIRSRIFQHILFWSLSYYYLLHFFSPDGASRIDLIYTAVFHLPLVLGVYLNLYLLIPGLLRRKRYLGYLLLTACLITLIAAFNIFIFNNAIDYFFPGYFFVSYYDFSELLQFSLAYIGLTTLLKLSRAWFKLLESENRLIRVQKEKKDAELLFLKNQINPHFLFNSLNSVYSLALKKDEQTPAAILKLAEVMRYMTYESNEDYVPLEKEISYIKNYIALQKLRMPDAGTVTFEINGDPGAHRIAPFIFIVFIENGFKHGVQGAIAEYFIYIEIDIFDNGLILNVVNSLGVTDEPMGRFRGFGLDNVKKRLELLYGERYELAIDQGSETYKVKLKLNLSYPLTA